MHSWAAQTEYLESRFGPPLHLLLGLLQQLVSGCGILLYLQLSSGKKQTDYNFYKNDDTFEIKFRHVSVVLRPSSVESRINLKLHLNL